MFQTLKVSEWVSVCGCEDGVSPREETQLEHPTPDTAAAGFVGWLTGELWLQTKCGAVLNSAWLSQTISTGLQSCAVATMCGEWFVQQLHNVTLPLFVFSFDAGTRSVSTGTFLNAERLCVLKLIMHIRHFVLILKALTGSRGVTFPF